MRLCKNVQKKLKHSRGFHPRRFVLPQKCDNFWTGNTLSSLQAQGRWGGRGHCALLQLTCVFISPSDKRNSPEPIFQQFPKKVFSRISFPCKKKSTFQMPLTRENWSCWKITLLICLLHILQGPGRLFWLLLIAAQEWWVSGSSECVPSGNWQSIQSKSRWYLLRCNLLRQPWSVTPYVMSPGRVHLW